MSYQIDGLRFKNKIPHSTLTRSWWDAIIQDLQRFRNSAKVIWLAEIQPETVGLQTMLLTLPSTPPSEKWQTTSSQNVSY